VPIIPHLKKRVIVCDEARSILLSDKDESGVYANPTENMIWPSSVSVSASGWGRGWCRKDANRLISEEFFFQIVIYLGCGSLPLVNENDYEGKLGAE
jgi:hypothetical protein